MAEFDVKRVTNLEWAGIGAGVLAFIVSFFPWASVDFGDEFGDLGIATPSVSGNAWDAGFLAWFSVLLLVAAAVVILLPHFGVRVEKGPLIWLGLAGLAFLFILLRWPTYGEYLAAAWGLFVGLILAAVSAVSAFLVFKAAPKPNAAPPYPGQAYGA